MQTLAKSLALSLAAFCVVPAVQAAAATAPLAINCYNGSTLALTLPVNGFFFDTGNAASQYFTVFTDISKFDDLVYETFFVNTFDYCEFPADMRTVPSTITLESLAANAGAGGQYTQLTFSYLGLSARLGGAVKPAANPALTRDEKAKALAAFLARVPAPVATQK